jgi:hypothetical protein
MSQIAAWEEANGPFMYAVSDHCLFNQAHTL